MNIALEKFKNIKNGKVATVYIDKNNDMYYAKSDDALYFTRHYDKKEDLYERLNGDNFQLYDEHQIANDIRRYNNPKRTN